jgi:acyl phosphate:glycerol-3-phosphate acyltransferase
VTEALLVVAGYLCGSLPFGYWLVRWLRGVDIRTVGSGNIGATNVWRTFGARLGLLVMLLDTLKGFAPALVASLWVGSLWGVLAGGAAMLGHSRPVFLKFARGGKMVATCGGAFFGVAPVVAGIGTAVWFLVFLACRYASVASITAALSLPIVAVALGEPWPVIAFAAAAALAVLFLHRTNIKRLRAGTETKMQLRRRPTSFQGQTPGSDPKAV